MPLEQGLIVGNPLDGTALVALDPEFRNKMEEILPLVDKTMINLNNHLLRKAAIKRYARTLNIPSDSLSKIITRYRLQELKKNRNIPYFHYHQTSIDNLANALQLPDQALLSMREQEKKGYIFDSQGSRPDLVQFTSDEVNRDGDLIKRAIQAVGATGTGVILVYKETLIQQDKFDIFDYYHGVPIAPFSELETILCDSIEGVQTVQELLKDRKANFQVQLVEDWYKKLEKKSN